MIVKQLLITIIILTMASGLFPGETASAAESIDKRWVLTETKINPDDLPLSNASTSRNFEMLDEFTITENSIYTHTYKQQFTYNDSPDLVNEFSIQFIFDKPPLELTPGNVFTLNIKGQMSLKSREQPGGDLGSDIQYIYGKEFLLRSIESEGKVQQDELPSNSKYGTSYSQVKLTVNENDPTGSFTCMLVLDDTWAENLDDNEINITLDSNGYRIIWVYHNEGTPKDEAPDKDNEGTPKDEAPNKDNEGTPKKEGTPKDETPDKYNKGTPKDGTEETADGVWEKIEGTAITAWETVKETWNDVVLKAIKEWWKSMFP